MTTPTTPTTPATAALERIAEAVVAASRELQELDLHPGLAMQQRRAVEILRGRGSYRTGLCWRLEHLYMESQRLDGADGADKPDPYEGGEL